MKIMALFLGYELAIPISTSFGEFSIGEWFKERHTEQWAALSGMKLQEVFVQGPSDEHIRELLALDRRKKMQAVSRVAHCTLIRHLHVKGL
jgi:hypothetical protein